MKQIANDEYGPIFEAPKGSNTIIPGLFGVVRVIGVREDGTPVFAEIGPEE